MQLVRKKLWLLQLAKKVLRLLLLEKNTNVAAAGKKILMLLLLVKKVLRWLQLVNKAPVVVVAAPVEAGVARPRRKSVKYNSPTTLCFLMLWRSSMVKISLHTKFL